MTRNSIWNVRGLALLALVAFVAACYVSTTTAGRALDVTAAPVRVESPVKVHLRDGSIVMFRRGATVQRDSITGEGERFTATLAAAGPTRSVALDSVLGAEAFDRRVNADRTIAYAVGTTLGAAATLALLKAIFGSCPTIYSDSAGVARLEAESFSYSITPMLEKRDVDRLSAQPDADGMLALEVRNEAMETHYIDQLQLLEVHRRTDEEVFPSPNGPPVAVRTPVPVAEIHDRAGRDLRRILARADESVFSTDSSTLARAAAVGAPASMHEDWIDVTIPRPASRDSVALLLRMRTSLLTTVLFYDYMLARPGARSLDWVARDMSRITTLAEVGRWYAASMGLRVAVREGGAYRQVARLADFGPIAWRSVAVMVPATSGDSVHVRLSFLADEWRIDQLSFAADMRRTAPRMLEPASVTTRAGAPHPDARDALSRADERRLSTAPGDRMFVRFDVGRDSTPRTFLIAAQGYYSEWVRGSWMRGPTQPHAFSPSRTAIDDVLRTWIGKKEFMEAEFFRARVPVL
ncbi:MAG: hypothetical protein ACJ8AD_07845 [Gemmatimonadaceae bacterium]